MRGDIFSVHVMSSTPFLARALQQKYGGSELKVITNKTQNKKPIH